MNNITRKRINLLLIVAALLLLSISFHVFFLAYKTNHIVTYSDFSERRTFDAEPIIPLLVEIFDSPCSQEGPCAIAIVQGIYTRWPISSFLAISGGLIIPFIIMIAAGYLADRALPNRLRLISSIFLRAIGSVLLLPAGAVTFFAFVSSEIQHLWDSEIRIIWIVAIIGLGIFAGGLWISRDAAYRNSPS